MNNSNSFNICPRCGTANGLNAKYCYQCGSQLKVPEQPVVCPRCHTVNNGMANFCRTCGATLRMGAQTKICPKCHREVPVEENVCSCGYSFATTRFTSPAAAGSLGGTPAPAVAEKSVPVAGRRGGRAIALFMFILTLLFAYVAASPVSFQLPFMQKVGFVIVSGTDALGGADYFLALIKGVTDGGIASLSVFDYLIGISLALTALCAVLQLISSLIRVFTGKRRKKANILYLILAILTTIAFALVALAQYLPQSPDFLKVFVSENYTLGYLSYSVPLFFWFFFIYSACAKIRKPKI